MRDSVVLAGSLSFLALGDIMQLLGANGSTGVLRLISRYAAEPGFIYFENGNPINAACGSTTGLEAVFELFGWTDGEFEFNKENVLTQRVITKSRMGIILEGLKMVDDGQIKRVGPGAAVRKQSAGGSADAIPIVKGPMVDYMYVADEEDFFDGEYIVEEGKHGSWIWVILEGVVEIVRETPEGQLPIVRLGDGSFIGSLASFLIQGHIRTATAVAVGNVQLGVLDSQRLAQEFAKLTPEFRGLLISLDKRLKQLNERVIELRQKKLSPEAYVDNKKPVMKQGTTEEDLYVIREGSGSIVRNDDIGQIPLVQLFKGDYFGSIPFLDLGHEPEFASVLANKDLKVRKAELSQLQKEYNNLSTTFKNFIDNVSSCISVSTRVVCNYYQKYGLKK
ncbi:cyclic nucleotide-binding domain-containing protein [Desulfatitalea tepidiphila]|uniref:cyclic nucleotide-binding domain-containing protein n=1 Tax=Desulfatitalea tepidiphila TaxID=1185843 RepID=UPI0006B4CF8B|nr:cyclic nucleotide-binding domain-containing protein [Desulfatitalea tepidiphila]